MHTERDVNVRRLYASVECVQSLERRTGAGEICREAYERWRDVTRDELRVAIRHNFPEGNFVNLKR